MAKRKSSPFDGPLAEPIIQPDPLVVAIIAHKYRNDPTAKQAVRETASHWERDQKIRKLVLLAERYGFRDLSDPNLWVNVCMRLAEECVPGFSVVETTPRGPGRSRSDILDLVKAVETLCATESITPARACQRLVSDRKGRWHGRNAGALENERRKWFDEWKKTKLKPKTKFLLALDAAAVDASARKRNSGKDLR